MQNLEPIFEGEEWPSFRSKLQWLEKAKHNPLLGRLSRDDQARIRRRVFIDLGSRQFSSSTRNFLDTYPSSLKFEIHAFDMDGRFARSWEKDAKKYQSQIAKARHLRMRFNITHSGVSDHDGVLMVAKPINKNAMQSFGFADPQILNPDHQGSFADSNERKEKIMVIDLARWLGENVKFEDFVVMKMDLEGMEYRLLPHLLHTGMLGRIDELMLEMHYTRRSHRDNNRTAVCTPTEIEKRVRLGELCIHREEATRWLKFLRSMCVYTHEHR